MALLDFLDKRNKSGEGEMSFIEHLEVLRWHIVRSVAVILIIAILSFVFSDYIIDGIIMGPTKSDFIATQWFCKIGKMIGLQETLCFKLSNIEFQTTTLSGQFFASFTIAFVVGFVLAFPYVCWEFWRFIRPALTQKEAKQSSGVIFWVSILFFIGVLFGYFILTPFMINFYFNYSISAQVITRPVLDDYLESLIYTTVGVGLLFQLPLLVLFLSKAGIVTAKMLKQYWRHAFLAVLIIAAIITPTTDPFSLAIVTVPLFLLYVAGIKLAARVDAKRAKDEEWS